MIKIITIEIVYMVYLLFIRTILHELSHAVMAKYFGSTDNKIHLYVSPINKTLKFGWLEFELHREVRGLYVGMHECVVKGLSDIEMIWITAAGMIFDWISQFICFILLSVALQGTILGVYGSKITLFIALHSVISLMLEFFVKESDSNKVMMYLVNNIKKATYTI